MTTLTEPPGDVTGTPPPDTPAQMYPLLSKAQLRTFDDAAFALIMRAQDHGWRGYMTKRYHCWLMAPDGVATMSVSRDSLRGRSGRNARATFARWLKAQAPESEPGSAFGSPTTETPDDLHLLDLLSPQLKRAGVLDWMAQNPERKWAGDWWAWYDEAAGNLRRWFVVDLSGGQVSQMWRGQGITVEEIDQILAARFPRMFEGKGADVVTLPGQAENQGDTTMKMFACGHEGCEYTSGHAGAMNLHRHSHNTDMVQCPHCDRQFASRSLGIHVKRKHTDLETHTCRVCDREFKGAGAYGQHVARRHGMTMQEADAVPRTVVTDEVSVADGAVTVAPPVSPANTGAVEPSQGVLRDYLEHLPQGDDAEAQVAAVRAIVAAPMVAEVRRLREDNERLERELKDLQEAHGELQAKLSLMREALGL